MRVPVLNPWFALVLLAAEGFGIPTIPVSLNIAGQPFSVPISGSISESMNLDLRADLGDFQAHLTPILKAELNRDDKCGERISIEEAVLHPAAPAANLTARLHVEKWACFRAFGKENAKRLIGGNAVVEVKVTPQVEDGTGIHLDADVGRIDADGSLGELLHSGSMGDTLRDKIRESVLKAIRKATDFNTVVPPQVRPYATVQSLSFAGDARLELRLTAQVKVPASQAASVLDQLRTRK